MTPEQERALALARARKRKAEAEAGGGTPDMGSPFLQRATDMTAAAIQSPGKGETRRVGKEGKLDAKNDRIRLSQSAQRAYANQVSAERRARVMPVEQAAGRAGAAAMGPGLMDEANPNAAYSEFMLSPEQQQGMQAERGVYRDKGVTSSVDAASLAGINATALGVPGFVSKDFRNEIGQAQADQPMAYAGGTIAGSILPFEAGWQVGKTAYNATLKPVVNALMPKGGSGLARGARLGQRYGEQVGGFAAQNAGLQATIGESNAAAAEGRDPSFASAIDRAAEGFTDPLNAIIPGALIGLNRLREFAVTGGRTATPKSVAEEIGARTGGTAGNGSILNAGLVGGPVDGRAERLLIRMLKDVGYSRDDIAGALSAFDKLADQSADLPVLASRLKDVFIEKLGPRAEAVVQDFLQGAGVSKGGTAGKTVTDAVTEDYGRLGQFLEDSASARLGAGSRYDTLTGAQQEMSRIGKEGYERVFGQPAPDAAAVDDLKGVLDFYGSSELASPLRQIAAGKMLNVEQMIAKDPRRAAHWMQMAAGMKAQEAFDAGNKVLGNAYTDMRNQILSRLEQPGVAPGYQQARMQFGDEFGVEQATTFGSRFFTKVTDSVGVRQLADDLRNLTPAQQEAALLSVRDELMRLAGRHREGAAPRLTQVGNEQSLAGLETVVGEKGGQLANDIRFVEQRLERLRAIDPRASSRTTSNTEARAFADKAVSNPTVRRIGNALQAIGGDAALTSVASGGTVPPIFSIRAAAGALGNKLAKGRQGKIDDVTSLLMRDVGASPRPAMPGDDLPPLTSRGGGAVPPPSAFSEISTNAQTVEPRNALGDPEALRQAVSDTPPLYRQSDADVRWQNIRSATRLEARNRGETLTPEQVDEAAAEMYRAMYKIDPPGMKGTRDMKAEGWVRSVEDAKRSLDRDVGPGMYTAEELEGEAARFYGEYYGYGTLPANSMELPSQLVGKQVDLVDFANRVVDAERLNATTKDMTIEDMVDLARRYDKAYRAKGGKGVTELEQMGHDIAQAADKSLSPKASGFGAVKDELGQQAILAGFGSIGGSANDLNGDGKKDWKDAAIGAAIPLVGINGVRAAGAARNALAGAGKRTVGGARVAGAGGAADDGFDTAKIIYRGSDDGRGGGWYSDSKETAQTYGKDVSASVARLKNPLVIDAGGAEFFMINRARLVEALGNKADKAVRSRIPRPTPEEIVEVAKAKGYDGVIIRNVRDDKLGLQSKPTTTYNIFDSNNVRPAGARKVGKTRTAGVPKTPQQAARFETPGSPEYQEALLNGDIRPTSDELYDALRQARKDGNDDVTEIRAIAKAVERIENGAIVEVITDAFRKFPVAREVADRQAMGWSKVLMSDERAAIAIVKRALAEARLQNKDPEAVFNEALSAYGARFGDPQDADFMRKSITDLMNMGNPDKAASPILTAGAGGKRPPKPDSPDAIKNALRDIAKAQPKEPTRFERMVRDNQIPVNSPELVAPDTAQAAGNRAQRMAERGKDPFEIYDETSIVFVPYNGKNIPIYSTQQGPEEVIRTFYSWLREPKETWPQFVTDIVNQAPKKRTMRLGDENAAAVPPGAIPEPPPPMPKGGFPYGGAAIGAGLGMATGIPGGALIGYAMTQRDRNPRNALAGAN